MASQGHGLIRPIPKSKPLTTSLFVPQELVRAYCQATARSPAVTHRLGAHTPALTMNWEQAVLHMAGQNVFTQHSYYKHLEEIFNISSIFLKSLKASDSFQGQEYLWGQDPEDRRQVRWNPAFEATFPLKAISTSKSRNKGWENEQSFRRSHQSRK